MRTVTIVGSLLILLAGSSLRAQAPKATIEQQLESEYKLTTPTADNTDLVTTGVVLILQKKGFSAGSVSNKVATQNTYKDGQIKSGAATAVRRFGGLPGISYIPGVGTAAGTAAGAAGGSRDFVNGEKLYVTKITVDRGKDGVIFDLISDAYGDAAAIKARSEFSFRRDRWGPPIWRRLIPPFLRYLRSSPRMPMPAGNRRPPETQAPGPAAAPAAAPPQQADAPPPPIPPPPPPADEPAAPPKTI